MTDPQQPTISATWDQAPDGSYTASVRVSGLASEQQAKADLQRMRGALSEHRPASVDFLPHDDILRFACRVLEGAHPTEADKTEARRGLVQLRQSIRPAASAPSREATGKQGLQVPAGWKLVPIEPTEEMCAAAVKLANGDAVYKNVAMAALKVEESIYGEAYAAMLSAAPSSPSVAAEETKTCRSAQPGAQPPYRPDNFCPEQLCGIAGECLRKPAREETGHG